MTDGLGPGQAEVASSGIMQNIFKEGINYLCSQHMPDSDFWSQHYLAGAKGTDPNGKLF